MEGYFLIHRSLFHHRLWQRKPFSWGAAWIDLIGLANHKDGIIFVRNMRIQIKRGQVGWSIVKMADRWGWSRTAVKTFLNILESEQQIEQQKNNITSIITITNYDKYQSREQQKEQQESSKRAAREQQESTNNKRLKNDKEVNPYNPLKKVVSPVRILPGTFTGKSDYEPSEEEAKAILLQIEKERFPK